ncbi:hypothetical protein M2405_004268 [Rhodococcus erythropolis]|nr:hypothetical protein [Rhodococcus erythropolis]MCW2425482.1 hypothetical protein [Rhodococcus erythropolis]
MATCFLVAPVRLDRHSDIVCALIEEPSIALGRPCAGAVASGAGFTFRLYSVAGRWLIAAHILSIASVDHRAVS